MKGEKCQESGWSGSDLGCAATMMPPAPPSFFSLDYHTLLAPKPLLGVGCCARRSVQDLCLLSARPQGAPQQGFSDTALGQSSFLQNWTLYSYFNLRRRKRGLATF